MISYVYTGVLEKPDDAHTDLFEQLMTECGLTLNNTVPLNGAASSTQPDNKDEKSKTLGIIENVAESTKPAGCKESIKVKQEIDTEFQPEDVMDKVLLYQNNINDGFNTSPVKQETADDVNTWRATYADSEKFTKHYKPLTVRELIQKGIKPKHKAPRKPKVHKEKKADSSEDVTHQATEKKPKVRREKKAHTCETCGKIFESNSMLVKHIRVHTKEKVASCPICNKQFSQHGYLRVHMQVMHMRGNYFIKL